MLTSTPAAGAPSTPAPALRAVPSSAEQLNVAYQAMAQRPTGAITFAVAPKGERRLVVSGVGHRHPQRSVQLPHRTDRAGGEPQCRAADSEPGRGERDWSGQANARQAVYANRRRIRGVLGKRLMRKRGEVIERSFAHCCGTGGMRRTHLRGQGNILDRLLVHVAGFNLGLAMRALVGIGKPRRVQDGLGASLFDLLAEAMTTLESFWRRWGRFERFRTAQTPLTPRPAAA